MNFKFQQGYLNGMQPQSAHLAKRISKSLSLGLALLVGTSTVQRQVAMTGGTP